MVYLHLEIDTSVTTMDETSAGLKVGMLYEHFGWRRPRM
jgi:hypothetical protein